MTTLMVPSFPHKRTLPSALLGLIALAACSDTGNTGRKPISEDLVRDIPWTNGAKPLPGDPRTPEPVYPPVGLGLPDPGSKPVDCSVVEGYEFADGWFETFEPPEGAVEGARGVAEAWAPYDDETPGSFRAPGFFTWYTEQGVRYQGALWGMPADRIEEGPECHGEPNNWAIHFRGGPFYRFGAGLDHPLALGIDPAAQTPLANRPCPDPSTGLERADFCPTPADPANEDYDSVGLPTRPDLDDAESRYLQQHSYWDLRSYDGIAFWARRGPAGPAGFAVQISDKHTSADLARENETFCRRLESCRSECLNGTACNPVNPDLDDTEYRCFDPEVGPVPNLEDGLKDLLYPRCGVSTCASPNSFVDPDYDQSRSGGRIAECRPYTFSNNESGEFCFPLNGNDPPGRDERCGDSHRRAVTVGPDWRFYTVPFSELRQQNFGKRAPYLDLSSIALLTFTFPMGWVDIYIDNVTFYRDRK